ncbi:MAG: amino acid permease [Betaproteobacteria bacterium]|nr:MAG: amino acid permease [Betaproteobacteria bacterium]
MVIGAGIFKAPSIVAGNTSSGTEFILAWVLGGIVSLCGALVYAELSSRYPETGGEYAFLSRGMGRGVAFVFAWSRMSVIQTGAIAAVAFVFGDYASEMLRLGEKSPAIYAAIGVVALTALNVVGTLESKTLQKVMQYLLFAGLAFIAVAGLVAGSPGKPATASPQASFGLAMIFVLLTYGGWNEAAYLGGEVRDARRNMMRILVGGILTVTVLYILVNLGYLAALGLGGIRESKAVAADVMRAVVGEKGVVLLALIVCLASLTTMNAAIFTGARTTYALGRDFSTLGKLGIWRAGGSTPANALLLQGAICLVLVALSSMAPDGFTAMVAYTSPVFWTFFLLTALTLFVFRSRSAEMPLFRVPLYPVIPLAFVGACLYMLYSSINYVRFAVEFGVPVLGGLAIMAAGIPLYFLVRGK